MITHVIFDLIGNNLQSQVMTYLWYGSQKYIPDPDSAPLTYLFRQQKNYKHSIKLLIKSFKHFINNSLNFFLLRYQSNHFLSLSKWIFKKHLSNLSHARLFLILINHYIMAILQALLAHTQSHKAIASVTTQ